MAAFHIEAVLAIGYVLALIIIATALEWLAKHSQQRADRYHTGGFRFDRDRDAWECPVGIALLRAEIDPERHAIVYRAPAHTCNSCQIKSRCTHSDRGREIVVPLDPWVRSASMRLQRGISLVLILLAAFILGIELFRHGHGVEGSALAMMLLIVVARFLKLLGNCRTSVT
ncbi:MAG TPA: hypothetical protein VH601_25445 [Bryobacteraceae bacterium]|jgi:hypothetical protein